MSDSPSAGTESLHSSARKTRARLAGVGYTLLSVVLVFAVWSIVVRLFTVPSYLLPPPNEVLQRLWEERFSLFGTHAYITALESVLAFLMAAVIGAILGIMIAYSRPLARLFYPLLVGSNALPKLALAPLFIVWLGFGLSSKVVIGFTIAFFPVVINTVTGLQAVPPEMTEMARSMGGGRLSTFRRISVPYALPSYFAGLKVAITLAVVGAVVGEFVGADEGLGYLVIVTSSQLASVLLFATLIALTGVAVALYLAVEALEYLLLPGPKTRIDLGR